MYIILTSLFAVMIIAIILIITKGKAKARARKQMLTDSLHKAANDHQITWTESELQTYRAIAWHEDKRILFFAHIIDGVMDTAVINMANVRRCTVTEKMQYDNLKAENAENYVKEVWLEVQTPNQETKKLCFYQELQDGVFEKSRLTQKARHYKALIDKQ